MSILSNILGALTASTAPVYVNGDAKNNDFTGSGLKNDNVIFDATVNADEKFGKGGDKNQDYSCLDGGLGIDTLTMKVTESQYAAYKAELAAKVTAMKVGEIDLNDIATLFKIATGQQAVKFDSLGVELKGWENIKFDVVKDAPPATTAASKPGDGGSDNGNNAAKDDVVGLNGHTTFTINDLLANDPGGADKDHTLYFGPSADPIAQAAYLAAHGITRTSDANGGTYEIATGATDIDYHVQIGNNGTWSTAHVAVNANHAPVATADTNAGLEDALITGSVATNDSDSDAGATLTYVLNGPIPAGLTLNANGSYTLDTTHAAYQHLASGAVQDVIATYTVTDQNGAHSTASLTIKVTGVNDAPVITPPSTVDATEDNILPGSITSTDVDDGHIAVYHQIADNPNFADGKVPGLTINEDGTFTFDAGNAAYQHLAEGETMEVKAHFSVDDKLGGYADSYLTIKVTGTDESPTCSCSCDPQGKLVAEWTFESHTQEQGDNVGTPTGFWDLSNWAANHPGIYGADADAHGFSNDIQVHGVNGNRGLDTAASPGNIFLQAIPEGRGGAAATMPDLVDGKSYIATVTILKQAYTDPALIAQGWEGTDPDAWVEFNFNGQVLKVRASDIHVDNQFVKFDMVFKGVAGEDGFTIQSHGTHDDNQGLIIDSIQVHEWNGHLGAEKLVNWDFEQDNAANANGFVDLQSISGWQNEAGTTVPMQVQHQSFNPGNPITGFASGEHQWLDSAASPGDIKIGQDLDIGPGPSQLSVSIAAEDIQYFNGASTDTYRPDADDHLLFKLNGATVLDVSLADFTDQTGHVDWNKFHDFKVNVTGQAGTDHLTIESTGNTQYTDASGLIHGYAGFAVDHVSVKEWVCHTPGQGDSLFSENFEAYENANGSNVVNPGGAYEVVLANLASKGWTGDVAPSVELGGPNYGGVLGNNSHWLDTQSTVDGVSGLSNTGQINIAHGFTDPTGGSVQLSFDIGKQDYNSQYVTNPDAKFEFRVDGDVVKTITAAELTNNQLSHYDMVVDGLSAGAHTLELVDTTDASSNVGFAIDNIAIHDWVVA